MRTLVASDDEERPEPPKWWLTISNTSALTSTVTSAVWLPDLTRVTYTVAG